MVLRINNLSKRYGQIQAVDNLSLEVPEGSVFGLLGPNGSGKSTTLGMVLGTVNPNSGTYNWFEQPDNAAHHRKRIGSLLERPNFYPYLSAVDNLKITCLIKNVDYQNIDRVLEITGLLHRKKSSVQTYSLGMHQRLAIANALVADPEILVLDEPTNGLDPQGIAEIRKLILQIARNGKTIILASHILDEVEKTCTHVAILKKGKLLATGTTDEIIGEGERIIIKYEDDLALLRLTLEQNPSLVHQVKQSGNNLVVFLTEGTNTTMLNRYLVEKTSSFPKFINKRNRWKHSFWKLHNKLMIIKKQKSCIYYANSQSHI